MLRSECLPLGSPRPLWVGAFSHPPQWNTWPLPEADISHVGGRTSAGAPCERVHFALEVIGTILETWKESECEAGIAAASPVTLASHRLPSQQQQQQQHEPEQEQEQAQPGTNRTSVNLTETSQDALVRRVLAAPFQPFSNGILTYGFVEQLLCAMVNSWDRIRDAAAQCLLLLPSPLPGLTQPQHLLPLLQWVQLLLRNARRQESDAGARGPPVAWVECLCSAAGSRRRDRG